MKSESVKLIKKRKRDILQLWIENQLAEDGLKDDLISNDDRRALSEELVSAFVNVLSEDNITDVNSPDFDKVTDIISGISVSRAKQGYSSRETGAFIFGLKNAVLEVLQQDINEASSLYAESMKVSKLFDNFAMYTFETFIKGREEVILRQTDEITEISTPVIRIWDGILALPIIGTLDSARTQVVMENLLQEIVDTGSSIAILDISGVPAVDSLVAQHLIKTVSATRLMGGECIISGIRPEIAQTVVHLGIDLSSIITKSTLASALKAAFAMLQLDVVRKRDKQLI